MITDEELLKIYCKAKSDYEGLEDNWSKHENLRLVAGLRAVIQHVRPNPIAAIQRPWARQGWLDESDRGWMLRQEPRRPPSWEFVHVSEMKERREVEILWNTESSPMRTAGRWTMCPPHWAMPLPLASPGDHFPGATEMVNNHHEESTNG
jgi:hypothetical protein